MGIGLGWCYVLLEWHATSLNMHMKKLKKQAQFKTCKINASEHNLNKRKLFT